MDTVEYATFRYDTVEVENRLKLYTVQFCLSIRKIMKYDTFRYAFDVGKVKAVYSDCRSSYDTVKNRL